MNQTTKAHVGQWYLDAIKARILTRMTAKQEQKDASDKALREAIIPLANAMFRHFNIGAPVHMDDKKVDIEIDTSPYRPTFYGVKHPKGGTEVSTPEAVLTMHCGAALTAFKKAKIADQKTRELARELCHEVAFLTDRLTEVARFQAFVSRLTTEAPTDTQLKALLEDYLKTRRPAVCNL